ncbi:MAG: pitrilysin family protein [bacterium]|nr:pitrilysin family protein [bacterium]
MLNPKTLSNGLPYHLISVPGAESATAMVLFRIGSRHEHDAVWGGSHFIEHLMFKGTEKHPTTLDISKKLDRHGAQYNAFTGKEYTGYYVKIAGDQIGMAVDLLHDMLFFSTFDEEEMEREKKVIVEEIKMYAENPIMHIGDLLEQAMYKGSRLGLDIAGTAKSVLEMNRDDVLAYRDAYYGADNMTVVLVGAIPDHADALLESTFGTVQKAKNPTLAELHQMSAESIRLERDYKDIEQVQLGIGFPALSHMSEDDPTQRLLGIILGGTMSSRLFTEIRERRGLCYSIRAGSDSYTDSGMMKIRAGLDAARLEEALAAIHAEVQKIVEEGVSDEELEAAKDHLAGDMKLTYEDTSARAHDDAEDQLNYGYVRTTDELISEYKAVSKEDIARVAKIIFRSGQVVYAVIGPYATDEDFLKLLP